MLCYVIQHWVPCYVVGTYVIPRLGAVPWHNRFPSAKQVPLWDKMLYPWYDWLVKECYCLLQLKCKNLSSDWPFFWRAQTQQAQSLGRHAVTSGPVWFGPYNIIALIRYVHFQRGVGSKNPSFSRKILTSAVYIFFHIIALVKVLSWIRSPLQHSSQHLFPLRNRF